MHLILLISVTDNVTFEIFFHCGGTYDRTKGEYKAAYVRKVDIVESDFLSISLIKNIVKLELGIKWEVNLLWVDPYLGFVRKIDKSEELLTMLNRLRIYRVFSIYVEEIVPDCEVEFDKEETIILSDDEEAEPEINEANIYYELEWIDTTKRKRVKMSARKKDKMKKGKFVKQKELCESSCISDRVESYDAGNEHRSVGNLMLQLEEAIEDVDHGSVDTETVVEDLNKEPEDVEEDRVPPIVVDDQANPIAQGLVEGPEVQPIEEARVEANDDSVFSNLGDFDWDDDHQIMFDLGDLDNDLYVDDLPPVHEGFETYLNNLFNETTVGDEGTNNRVDDEDVVDEENGDNVMEEELGVEKLPRLFCDQNIGEYTGEKDWMSEPDDSDDQRSLKSEDGDEETRYPEFNEDTMMDDPQFSIGMLFCDGDQVRRAIREYAILNRKKIRFVKNEPWRIRAKCASPCKWMIFVSRKEKEDKLQVKTLIDEHVNCRPIFENHSISSTWLGRHYLETFRWNPNWPIHAFQQQVRVDFGCQVSRVALYNARKKARNLLAGDHKLQYGQLYHYCKTLKHIMPGTTTSIKYMECPEGRRFMRMYVALGPLKKGFIEGCRPIVCIDACFLTGPYKGQLMAAVGLDANNGMWPVAYAVVEKETKKAWTWFLKLLVDDIAITNPTDWTFMSDRQKVKFVYFVCSYG